MYRGYVGYGDVELVNVARLVKYAEEGAAPAEVELTPKVGEYADLPSALGDEPYRTVLLDSPPWYDPTNPDSAQFAGLLVLEMTGVDGSTRKRVVTEGISDGGRAGASRADSRAIAVTALALGATDAALDAGLAWLAGVLHPPCAGDADSCGGLRLNLFAAAPAFCDRLPNLDADLIVTQLVTSAANHPGPSIAFRDLYASYLDPICGPITVAATVSDPLGDVPDGATATLDLVDSAGNIYGTSGPVPIADSTGAVLTATAEVSPAFPADWQPLIRWQGPAGEYGGTLRILTWTYSHYPVLTPDECLSNLRRSFRNVVTTAGPDVVQTLTLEDGTPYAARVEWTWVATDPVVYGDTDPLLNELAVGNVSAPPPPLFAETATTSAIGLTAPAPPRAPATNSIGGVVINTPGQRILFKNHGANNGIRVFQGYGLPYVRASDMDTWSEVVGAVVLVTGGSQAGYWSSTAAPGGTLNTTSFAFTSGTPAPAGYDDSVAFQAVGLEVGDNGPITGSATACPAPSPVLVLCGDDPDLPTPLAPPAPPTLADAGMPTFTDYSRREFQIPPSLSPQPAAALSFAITNLSDVPYRGIRVRLWIDPEPDFGVDEECDFDQEFYVTYIDAGQTVTIDGPNRRVTTTCLSGIDDDHERSMRGAYGGPFAFPELRCGYRYHVAIDVPVITEGAGISVDVTATRRGV